MALKVEFEAMKKRQFEMEEQIRQFMISPTNQTYGSMDGNQEFGGNGGVGGHGAVNEKDEDDDEFDVDDYFLLLFYF